MTFAEAYIGDTPAPVKRLSNLGDLEDKLRSHIHRCLMVETPEYEEDDFLLSDDYLAMMAELYIYKHNRSSMSWDDTCKHYGVYMSVDNVDLVSMIKIFESIDKGVLK